jgi:uncharacterized protein (DUF433 family)
VVALEQFISEGKGLYTLAEVAKYARMHHNTVARWFRGSTDCERVFSTLGDGEKTVSFLDFIQTLAVRNLRVHYNVPLQKIREAVTEAERRYGMSHPFARRHTTYLFENDIWIELETGAVVQASGKERGQEGILKVIENFLRDVSFDPDSGLASHYEAFSKRNIRIVMNPKLRFGEPMIEGCGYTPEVLAEAAKTEGSIDLAARYYGVPREQVEVAIDYFDYLQAA